MPKAKMSSFQAWEADELALLQRLALEAEGVPDWKTIARAFADTGRTATACAARWQKALLETPTLSMPAERRPAAAASKRQSIKPEPLDYPLSGPGKWSLKSAPTLPPKGTDVLIRCEGDLSAMGGVTHQVARVLAVLKGGVKVHWHGWTEMHQQDEDSIVYASSGRLLGWDTKRHRELAAQHVREIKAIDEGPIALQYQMPGPDQYFVRAHKSYDGIAKVTDRAIRQMGHSSPFEVSWYLEYELEKYQKHNGYVAARECEPAAAPTLSGDRSAVQIDLSERRADALTLSLLRHGDSIWVALDDLSLFAGRKIPLHKFPKPLASRIKDRRFALRGEKPRERKALPLQLYKTFIECLPWDLASAFRQPPSADEPSDAEWLMEKIDGQLQEAGLELPEEERLVLPVRDDEVVYTSGTDANRRVRVRVRIQPGKQPLLSGVDLFSLIERKSRNFVAAKQLLMKTLRQFVHGNLIKFSGASSSNSPPEPTIPADCLDLMLDRAIARLPDDKIGRKASFAHFRDTSEYHWIRGIIEDLTDSDAETSVLSHEDELEAESGSSESDDEGQDEVETELWQPVEWKDIKPSPPCPVALQRPHWTQEAEACIPDSSSDRKHARAGDFYYHSMVRKEEQEKIDRKEIESILTNPKAKPVSSRVGVAEILDPEHHVLKAARKNDYQGPVYLAYAKRKMKAYTILGEYTGRVVTDSMAEAEEDERKKEMAETSSSEAAARGEVFSKFQYNTTVGTEGKKWKQSLVLDTSNAANELSILNDYRLEATAGAEAARKQRQRKEHLPNVTFIEVVDKAFGRPHMLFALTRHVEKDEELLTDYGDGFWEQYTANCKWMAALRHARAAGLAEGEKNIASLEATRLAAEQAARKAAEEREAEALETVRLLQKELASYQGGKGGGDAGSSALSTTASAAASSESKSRSCKRGRPAAAEDLSPPVRSRCGPSSGRRRKVPKTEPLTDEKAAFKKGDLVRCPDCKKKMQAPRSAYALSCANCKAEIHPDTPTTPTCLEDKDDDEDDEEEKEREEDADEGDDSAGDDDDSDSHEDEEQDGDDSASDDDDDGDEDEDEDEEVSAAAAAKRPRRNLGAQAHTVLGFRVGAVVWAKYDRSPFWPAVVCELRGNDKLDAAARQQLEKDYRKLSASGSTLPAYVLVKWFGYDEVYDWISVTKLSCETNTLPPSLTPPPPLPPPLVLILKSIFTQGPNCARVCVCCGARVLCSRIIVRSLLSELNCRLELCE